MIDEEHYCAARAHLSHQDQTMMNNLIYPQKLNGYPYIDFPVFDGDSALIQCMLPICEEDEYGDHEHHISLLTTQAFNGHQIHWWASWRGTVYINPPPTPAVFQGPRCSEEEHETYSVGRKRIYQCQLLDDGHKNHVFGEW